MSNEEYSKSTDTQHSVCKIVATYLSFNYEIRNQQQSGSEIEKYEIPLLHKRFLR